MCGSIHNRLEPTRRSQPVALLASGLLFQITLLFGPWLGAAGVVVAPCESKQRATLGTHSEGAALWRCALAITDDQAYLIHVDQSEVDVILTVADPEGRASLVVDAPTRRAGPELALLMPPAPGRYTLELRAASGNSMRTAELTVEAIARRGLAAPRIQLLRDLTLAAKPDASTTTDSAVQTVALLRESLGRMRAAGLREYEAELLLRVTATLYWKLLDWSAAAASASETMTMAARDGDLVLRAQAALYRAASLIEIASALKQSGRGAASGPRPTQFDEAKQLLSDAARVFEQVVRPYDRAHAINFLGIASFYAGDFAAARDQYLQAARIFEALDEPTSEALPRQNIARIDYDFGDYGRAIDSYHSVLRVLDANDDAGQYLTVLLNLGSAQYVMGEFEQSLRSFFAALELSLQHRLVLEEARSLHGLGMVYLALGERGRAAVFLERALSLREPNAHRDPRGLQTSRWWVGDLKRSNGDIAGALALHLAALDSAMTVTEKVRTLYSIGRDHEAGKAPAAAVQAYESALKLDLPEDWPLRASVMGALGGAKLSTGDASGRDMCLRAARLHERRGDIDLAAQSFLALALDDRARGRLTDALANVREALGRFERQRLRTVNPDLRATYLGSRASAFELQGDLYATLWTQAPNPGERHRLQELSLQSLALQKRQLLEDFRQLAAPPGAAAPDDSTDEIAALDAQIAGKRHRLSVIMEFPNPVPERIESLRRDIDLLRTRLDLAQAKVRKGSDAAAPSSARRTVSLSASLASDEAELIYQLGESRSWLWIATREGAQVLALPPRLEVERAARRLYAAWSTFGSGETDIEAERAASRTILGPAAPLLRDKARIAVVADGILRALPFGALRVDTGQSVAQRLAESHAIVFRSIPGGDAPSSARARTANRILLVGDPQFGAQPLASRDGMHLDPWALQPLPGSREEVRAIVSLADAWRSDVLVGAQATKLALLAMPLDAFRTIHFATHARVDLQDPQLSSIALSGRQASSSAAASTLTVREILGVRLRAETVVLSACEASLGKNYGGQLSFGLSEAFLLAGADNVLGSLWRVSDAAAQEYMRQFYAEYVRHDALPAVAAQAAARALSRQPQFSHPYYWAAFVMTQR